MQRGAADARRPVAHDARRCAARAASSPSSRRDLREAMIHDEDDRRLMQLSRLRSTMAIPLAPSGGPLGALGLGVGRSGRWYDEDDLRFATLLVGRAGPRARQRAAGRPADRDAAAARRHPRLARRGGHGAGHARPDGLRERRGGTAARAARRPGGAHRRPGRPRRALRDPPRGRPAGARSRSCPATGCCAARSPEPLLTRSVYRATGEVHWFLTKATALVDETGELLAVNVIEDVTEEREAALRERFLADAGQALASSLDYEETLQRVAQLAVPALADWCAIELPDERGRLEQVALAHVEPAAGRARRASCASATRPTPTRRRARRGDALGRAAAVHRHPRRAARSRRRGTPSSSRASARSACARR